MSEEKVSLNKYEILFITATKNNQPIYDISGDGANTPISYPIHVSDTSMMEAVSAASLLYREKFPKATEDNLLVYDDITVVEVPSISDTIKYAVINRIGDTVYNVSDYMSCSLASRIVGSCYPDEYCQALSPIVTAADEWDEL